MSSVVTGLGPSDVASLSFTLGSLSPTLIVMTVSPWTQNVAPPALGR
jgi:hypothetical protein